MSAKKPDKIGKAGKTTISVNGETTSKITNKLSFPEEPAYVSYNLGSTLNMGNYESLRVDIRITMPCLPKDVQKTYSEIEAKVEDLLDKKIKSILKDKETGV